MVRIDTTNAMTDVYQFCLNCYNEPYNYYVPNIQVMVLSTADFLQHCAVNIVYTTFENLEFIKDRSAGGLVID